MTGFWRQFRFLSWKALLTKKRQKKWLFVELLVPIVLFAILALVRTRDFVYAYPQCHYDSKAFPSAGLAPFVQSYACSLANTCLSCPSTDGENTTINDGRAINDSIITRSLHIMADTLAWSADDPRRLDEVIGGSARLVHLLASLDVEQWSGWRVCELLNVSTCADAAPILAKQLNLSTELAGKLGQAVLTPRALWRVAEMSTLSPLNILSDVPLFSNRTVIEENFLFNGSLSDSEVASLARHQSAVDVIPLAGYVDRGKIGSLALVDGSRVPVARVLASVSQIRHNLRGSPLEEAWLLFRSVNWSDPNDLMNKATCGRQMLSAAEITSKGKKPAGGDQSIIDELKSDLIKFIDSVTPGKEKRHDKVLCGRVPIHDDMNCSMLEGAALATIKPMLAGYILVSPRSPVMEQLVEILNRPLQLFDRFRNSLYSYQSLAPFLQDQLQLSDFAKAAQNVLRILLENTPIVDNHTNRTDPVEAIEFWLEHLFGSRTDEFSFGNFTGELIHGINKYTTCFLADRFVLVDNVTDMEQTAVCLQEVNQYFSGIDFQDLNSNSTKLQKGAGYRIRHLAGMVDGAGRMDRWSHQRSRDSPLGDLKYLTFGVGWLQEAVDHAIIEMNTGRRVPIGVYAQQEPYPPVWFDSFDVSQFLAIFVILSWMIPASLLVKNIVHEKEQRLKELMRIMGLGDAIHFVSWASVSLALNTLSLTVIACLLKFANILPHIDLTLLIVFLFLFSVASICQALLLSTLFSNANIATACTSIVYFLFFFPYQLSVRSPSPGFTRFTLIFPQTTLGYGFLMLARSDDYKTDRWETLDEVTLDEYGVNMLTVLFAFLFESIGFALLAWYVSAVYPGVYGVGQRWYFPLTKRYWCPRSVSPMETLSDEEEEEKNAEWESEPKEVELAVRIEKMSKTYGNNTRALDGLSLRLYEGQITALLGHNGAGKTTTMSMLCGLMQPSSGTALVYGRDIRSEMRAVRDQLGICPQYNVLFDLLSVREQLVFYAALKGVTDEELDREVDEIIAAVGLTEKSHAMAGQLSGGQKRRVCIAIALVGGSRFVILDEPTAGVDVNSRREIWTLLQASKKGRTVLLSTHHMDEADVLADRVAVLAGGRLRALGSPLHLKNTYAHHLTVHAAKKDPSVDYAPAISGIAALSSAVSCELVEQTEQEMVFRIPMDAPSEDLEQFFRRLDGKMAEWAIEGYGLTAPTLQQIFVSLAPQSEEGLRRKSTSWMTRVWQRMRNRRPEPEGRGLVNEEEHADAVPNGVATAAAQSPLDFDVTPVDAVPCKSHRWYGHVGALLACRWHYTRRSNKVVTFEVFLPILLLLLCELYAKMQLGGSQSDINQVIPSMIYSTSMYGFNMTGYVSLWDRSNESETSRRLVESLVQPPGFGLSCMSRPPWQGGCFPGSEFGSFDWDRTPGNVSYNVNQTCGQVGQQWTCSQDDYPFDEMTKFKSNTTEVFYDMSYMNISQMRQITNEYAHVLNSENLFQEIIFGGWSLGHLNARSENASRREEQVEGWRVLLKSLSSAASTVSLNLSAVDDGNWTRVDDPFVTAVSLDDVIAASLNSMEQHENVKLWFNNKLWLSLPIFRNALSNALLRVLSEGSGMNVTDPSSLGILTGSQPINSTASQNIDATKLQKVSLMRVILLMLCLCVIPAGFSVFLVEDRESHSRHLQRVSGVRNMSYWGATYLFDMSVFVSCCLVILFLYLLVGVEEITSTWRTFFDHFFVMVLYGACVIQLVYLLQRRFTVPALSFVIISIGMFFIGTVTTMTVMLLEKLMIDDPSLGAWHTGCSLVFQLVPQYNLGMAIYRSSFIYQLKEMGWMYLDSLNRSDLRDSLPLPPLLAWPLMGRHAAALLIETILFVTISYFLELGGGECFRKLEASRTRHLLDVEKEQYVDEDEDVAVERQRVEQTPDRFGLTVHKLAKAYGRNLAVRDVSFGVERGECFGLLGLNGAGKTTTFGMMTGRLEVACGTVTICGQRVRPSSSAAFHAVGYCPQFDALNMKLTVKENLEFYAAIRGIAGAEKDKTVSQLLSSLRLSAFSDVETRSLSGGNRRKLSVAIALISNPPVIMLDEPSSGMDPSSQQFMWTVIAQLRRAGTTVILTSHSMEECEALCTRIAIMDGGRLRCVGSRQHLNNKFGDGYSVTLKLATSADAHSAADFMKARMDGTEIVAIHCTTAFVRVKKDRHRVADILAVINKLKSRVQLDDFSLSQTTLEEIFHSFAQKKKKDVPSRSAGSAGTPAPSSDATASQPPPVAHSPSTTNLLPHNP